MSVNCNLTGACKVFDGINKGCLLAFKNNFLVYDILEDNNNLCVFEDS